LLFIKHNTMIMNFDLLKEGNLELVNKWKWVICICSTVLAEPAWYCLNIPSNAFSTLPHCKTGYLVVVTLNLRQIKFV
jgi:hypothetical protein